MLRFFIVSRLALKPNLIFEIGSNELKIMILFLGLQLYGRTKGVLVYNTDTAVGYDRTNSAETGQGALHIILDMQRLVGNGPERSIAFLPGNRWHKFISWS
jgi:hypothetical protein